MKAVLQRVTSGRVTVSGETVGEIGAGLVVLLGVAPDDSAATADKLARKTAELRIFADEDGKMNRSLRDLGGDALVVSQFTLLADASRGTRPSYIGAARPEQAEPLYRRYVEALQSLLDRPVATGRFGAMMTVEIVNDGPVTILLDA